MFDTTVFHVECRFVDFCSQPVEALYSWTLGLTSVNTCFDASNRAIAFCAAQKTIFQHKTAVGGFEYDRWPGNVYWTLKIHTSPQGPPHKACIIEDVLVAEQRSAELRTNAMGILLPLCLFGLGNTWLSNPEREWCRLEGVHQKAKSWTWWWTRLSGLEPPICSVANFLLVSDVGKTKSHSHGE